MRSKQSHGERGCIPDGLDAKVLEVDDIILEEGVVNVVVAVCKDDVEFLVQSFVENWDKCQQVREWVS